MSLPVLPLRRLFLAALALALGCGGDDEVASTGQAATVAEDESYVVMPISSPTSTLASAVPRVSCRCSAIFSAGISFRKTSRMRRVCRGVPTPMVSPRDTW